MEQDREVRNKPMNVHSTDFNRGPRNIQWRKDSLFINGVGKLDVHMKKIGIVALSYTYTKINSKWIRT